MFEIFNVSNSIRDLKKNGIQVQTYDQTLIYTFDYLYNANQWLNNFIMMAVQSI